MSGPTTLLTQELGKGALWRFQGSTEQTGERQGGAWRHKEQRTVLQDLKEVTAFLGGPENRAWKSGNQ